MLRVQGPRSSEALARGRVGLRVRSSYSFVFMKFCGRARHRHSSRGHARLSRDCFKAVREILVQTAPDPTSYRHAHGLAPSSVSCAMPCDYYRFKTFRGPTLFVSRRAPGPTLSILRPRVPPPSAQRRGVPRGERPCTLPLGGSPSSHAGDRLLTNPLSHTHAHAHTRTHVRAHAHVRTHAARYMLHATHACLCTRALLFMSERRQQ